MQKMMSSLAAMYIIGILNLITESSHELFYMQHDRERILIFSV